MSKTDLNTATADIPSTDPKTVFKLVIENQLAQLGPEGIHEALVRAYGDAVWTSAELLDHFEVSHFDPPYVHVIRKSDGLRGTVAYTEEPRFYFSFVPLKENE